MRVLLIIATLISVLSSASAGPEGWRLFANARFGTVIEYPARFKALPPPENGDGMAFEAADGGRLTVSAFHNVNDETPQSFERFLREDKDGAYASVSYRAAGPDWLVLSGLRGDDIYYERIVFWPATETVHHLVITYPTARRSAYDTIIGRLARSLRVRPVTYQESH